MLDTINTLADQVQRIAVSTGETVAINVDTLRIMSIAKQEQVKLEESKELVETHRKSKLFKDNLSNEELKLIKRLDL